MMWRLPAVVTVLVASSTALAPVGIASAKPPADRQEPSCSFTLSPPSLVQISGANMVTATLTPYPCTGLMGPNDQTVCVSANSINGAGQCMSEVTAARAQVYMTPYVPGVTYTSTGRGCATLFDRTVPADQGSTVCKTFGPYNATL